jgi:hypothetical protein
VTPDVFVAELGKTLRTVLWLVFAVEALGMLDALVRWMAR